MSKVEQGWQMNYDNKGQDEEVALGVDLFTFSMQQHFRLHIPGSDSDARGEHDAPL